MNAMKINQFKTELENRFNEAQDHTEKYDYLEAVEHTLTFLNVNDTFLNEMISELKERVNKDLKAEYGR